MKEVRGDLFKIDCDVICITTNGYVSEKGKAVMGRGCAKELRDKEPGIDFILGAKIREFGNSVNILKQCDDGKLYLSFPVKTDEVINDGNNIVTHAKSKFSLGDKVPGYLAKADINIIESSARALRRFADANPEFKTILIPRPGCGAGELNWKDVKKVIEPYLDDRFKVVTFEFSNESIFYAGIGARNSPPEAITAMKELAVWLSTQNLILRSGGAEGADSAFEEGAVESEIMLPWANYRNTSHQFFEHPTEAREIASSVHGNWEGCSEGVKKLHTRNAMILLGPNLDNKVRFVVCWTENGQDQGGTGIALKIARNNQIPIFNMGFGIEETVEDIKRYVLTSLFETRVVNLYKQEFDVYIGRPRKGETSIWQNPFVVGVDGDRDECIKLYEPYIRAKLDSGEIPLSELRALKGKRLGCFCKPQACHGDVLVKLINEHFP